MLLDKRSEASLVGATKRVDYRAVLDEEESRHGSNRVPLCHLCDGINIDLEEDC